MTKGKEDRMRHPRRSDKGQMPFAIIAVTLLILGSAYGVIATHADDAENNTENITNELDLIGVVISNTESFVERGMGEIIYDISVNASEGTLDERSEKFDKRSEEWMKLQFPLSDSGVKVTLTDFDFSLNAESLKMSSEDVLADGYIPSYLKCTGTFTAKFVSDSGSSERTVEVETDGTCALPLVAEQGSLFDNALSDPGSLLAQIMTYQLTSLAQYRVINGYGALSEYGSMGTMSIITEEDVKKAYNESMHVLELLFFRTTSDGTHIESDVDLADRFVAEDGKVEIDLSAIYSQALMSIIDDLALQLFDYMYGNVALNIVDFIDDTLHNAWDSLKGFFKKTNEFTAAPYIKGVMEAEGYSESFYRYMPDGSYSITVPSKTVRVPGSDITLEDISFTLEYPEVDLLKWKDISSFKKHYREDTNEIREELRNIINTAAYQIGQKKLFGTVIVDIDSTDENSLFSTIADTVSIALKDGMDSVNSVMTSAISEQKMSDPFYAEIYQVISEDAEKIYGLVELKSDIRSVLIEKLNTQIFKITGTYATSSELDEIASELMADGQISDTVKKYEGLIRERLEAFNALNNVPEGQGGLIKKIGVAIVKAGALFTDLFVDVPERIVKLYKEIDENIMVNPFHGLTELPETDDFTLVDDAGSTSIEKLFLVNTYEPKITVKGPNSNLSECMHYVGFEDRSGASYCTVFSVIVEDTVDYSVESTGTLTSSVNMNDSAMNGSASVDLELKIAVASGWGLAGVKDYNASNTLLGDIWEKIVEIVSALIEPLRKVMSMLMDVMSVLSSALIEVAKFVASVVERIYNAIIEPLEKIKNAIENAVGKFVSMILEGLVTAIVSITGEDQTIGLSFMGFYLTLSTKVKTWINNTKTLLVIGLGCDFDKLDLNGSITIKQKGSGSNKEMVLTGSATIAGNGWELNIDIDPLMKTSGCMVYIYGCVKGVAFDITMPKLVQYKEIDLSLSDIPVVGAALSNIPLPIPGIKASIDAGFNLKYNLPFESGVSINEFELNPEGTDTGKEWVELYNSTSTGVDLNGYTISAGSNPATKVYTISDTVIKPGGRAYIILPGTFLNNSGSTILSSGEKVILKDPSGETVDSTPAKKDSSNDNRTWQRVSDGSTDWTFAEGTPDGPNCGGFYSATMIQTQIIKVFKKAAIDTLGDMKELTSTGDLSEYFKKVMYSAIDNGIEMIAGCVVEASVYFSLDITDATSTLCAGFRVSLSVDSNFVEQGLKYLAGEIEELLLKMENPYQIDPKVVIADNTYLNVLIYVGLTCPGFLKDLDLYPQVRLAVSISTNVAGLTRIVGDPVGSWKVVAGVLIMDCPTPLVPSALSPDRNLGSDLWLVHAVFQKAKK